MDFLYRNAAPAYKGMNLQPQATNGLFSGLFCNLLGGATPSYKTVDGRGAQASTPPRCWWQAFVTTPSYKTAPRAADCSNDVVTIAGNGESAADSDSGCGCEVNDATQVVIL
jgi:hypothetical protein